MVEDYHGWDQEEDHWRFADVVGKPYNETVFVISNFGSNTTARQALSAILSAMNQFHRRVQVEQTDVNTRLIEKLKEASMLRATTITCGDDEHWGILGVHPDGKAKKKKPWWKYW
ncbi:MAG: hypothetical protein AAFX06_02975 [Planctomycetota bacterium]